MPREAFQRQLSELQDHVLEMGSMVDRAVDRAMTALLDRDAVLAQEVVEHDQW
jgi:phosphate transport system protein